jgi:hypothetical protein
VRHALRARCAASAQDRFNIEFSWRMSRANYDSARCQAPLQVVSPCIDRQRGWQHTIDSLTVVPCPSHLPCSPRAQPLLHKLILCAIRTDLNLTVVGIWFEYYYVGHGGKRMRGKVVCVYMEPASRSVS